MAVTLMLGPSSVARALSHLLLASESEEGTTNGSTPPLLQPPSEA
jgi:hypothetical protein